MNKHEADRSILLDRPQGISLSFNGGKDCTVILHLYVAVLYKMMGSELNKHADTQHPSAPHHRQHDPIPSIYVTHKNPFGQVERFVDDEIERYNLELLRIPGPMKEALGGYHALKGDIKAIMVGTRRDDPHGGRYNGYTKSSLDSLQVRCLHTPLTHDSPSHTV